MAKETEDRRREGEKEGREAFPFPCPNLCRLNERIGAPALHLLETRIISLSLQAINLD